MYIELTNHHAKTQAISEIELQDRFFHGDALTSLVSPENAKRFHTTNRILVHQINQPECVFYPLCPTVNHLYAASEELKKHDSPIHEDLITSPPDRIIEDAVFKWLLPPLPTFTSQIWETKSPYQTTTPNQIMPAGGRMFESDNGDLDARAETAKKLGLELHLYGVMPEMVDVLTNERISFKDRKRIRHYHDITWTETEVAPFQSARFFDKDDHISLVVSLAPTAVEYLMENETLPSDYSRGRNLHLLDSLSTKDMKLRKLRGVITDGKEERIKDLAKKRAYAFEVRTVKEIVSHLFQMADIEGKDELYARSIQLAQRVDDNSSKLDFKKILDEYRELFYEMEKRYSENHVELEDGEKLGIPLTAETISVFRALNLENHLKKRVNFMLDLHTSLKRVRFEHDLRFIANSGEQKPVLLAQILLKSGYISSYEFNYIKERNFCPQVCDIIETACEVFGIKTESNPNWFMELQNKIRAYRDLKVKIHHTPSSQFPNPEEEEYRRTTDTLKSIYANRLGVDIEDLAVLAAENDEFDEYIRNSLKNLPDLAVLSQLIPDPRDSGTSQIAELFLRAFGFDQYSEERDRFMTIQKQLAAWRNLLDLKTSKTTSDFRNAKLQESTYPFRGVFAEHTQEDMTFNIVEIFSGYTLRRYRFINLPWSYKETELNFGLTKDFIPFSRLPAFCLSAVRDKEKQAVKRKAKERGIDMHDFFGEMIILDREAFIEEHKSFLSKFSPKQAEMIVDKWAEEVTIALLRAYKDQFETAGYNIEISRVREIGNMQGILEKAGLSKPDENYPGSGATGLITSPWLKFVFMITRDENGMPKSYEEEIQIFTSRDGAGKKLTDPFYIQRLFTSHTPGRYPLIRAYYGFEGVYEEVIRGGFEEGVIYLKRRPAD